MMLCGSYCKTKRLLAVTTLSYPRYTQSNCCHSFFHNFITGPTVTPTRGGYENGGVGDPLTGAYRHSASSGRGSSEESSGTGRSSYGSSFSTEEQRLFVGGAKFGPVPSLQQLSNNHQQLSYGNGYLRSDLPANGSAYRTARVSEIL